MIVIEEKVTLEDLDEAISNVYAMLKSDNYGNRKQLLETSLDDLLDARLNLTKTGSAVID